MALDFTLALEIHNGYPQWMKDMKELVVDMLGCMPSNQWTGLHIILLLAAESWPRYCCFSLELSCCCWRYFVSIWLRYLDSNAPGYLTAEDDDDSEDPEPAPLCSVKLFRNLESVFAAIRWPKYLLSDWNVELPPPPAWLEYPELDMLLPSNLQFHLLNLRLLFYNIWMCNSRVFL